MDNLLIRINPLTKLRIYKEIEKILFAQMDRNAVTPERGENIFRSVQESILDIETSEEADAYAQKVSNEFPELQNLYQKFQSQTDEKIDHIVSLLVEQMINKSDFDTAEKIMAEIKELETKNGKTLEQIRAEYPAEFENILQNNSDNL